MTLPQLILLKWFTSLVSIKQIRRFQNKYPFNNYSLLIKSFLYDTDRDLIEDEFQYLATWIIISEIIQTKLN